MSSLVLEIRRVPKAGKFFGVIDAMRKAMSETERIGMVTATATSSHLYNKDVVTTSRLNNIDELELIEDNVFTSSDFSKEGQFYRRLMLQNYDYSGIEYDLRRRWISSRRESKIFEKEFPVSQKRRGSVSTRSTT